LIGKFDWIALNLSQINRRCDQPNFRIGFCIFFNILGLPIKYIMNLYQLLSGLFLMIFVTTACSSRESNSSVVVSAPPNIIIIMADDLGYGELGCYGNPDINTPNLDRLAEQGIKFTDFHSNGTVCTPTRAALLTGRYQQRAGLEGVIYVKGETRRMGMSQSEVTLAEVLREAGYSTAIMGKWHLGYDRQYNPVNQGFDEFYGYVSGNIDYHTHYDNAGIYDWFHNQDSMVQEGYVTDLITSNSVQFIEENHQQPFFLYVAHEAPHVPLQGRNDPGYRFPGEEFSYYGPVEDQDRAYKEMVEVMDEGIGDIVAILERLNLDENTLIFFLSDNGPKQGLGKNHPLSGYKGGLWEGGHRVPAIAYWKGRIFPASSDLTLMSHDLFPTVATISGIELTSSPVLDGVDFSNHLLGADLSLSRTLFWRYRDQRAARSGAWKLLVTKQDTLLFNLLEDLQESVDVSTQNPEKLQQLLNELADWEGEMDQVTQKTS